MRPAATRRRGQRGDDADGWTAAPGFRSLFWAIRIGLDSVRRGHRRTPVRPPRRRGDRAAPRRSGWLACRRSPHARPRPRPVRTVRRIAAPRAASSRSSTSGVSARVVGVVGVVGGGCRLGGVVAVAQRGADEEVGERRVRWQARAAQVGPDGGAQQDALAAVAVVAAPRHHPGEWMRAWAEVGTAAVALEADQQAAVPARNQITGDPVRARPAGRFVVIMRVFAPADRPRVEQFDSPQLGALRTARRIGRTARSRHRPRERPSLPRPPRGCRRP